ncbi:MAG: hypothetical protein WEB88_01220 [Gemmatimonadota bacterium]
MAEIEMERRPRRPLWPWLVLVVLLIAAGVGGWLYRQEVFPGLGGDDPPAAEAGGVPEADNRPIPDPDDREPPGGR